MLRFPAASQLICIIILLCPWFEDSESLRAGVCPALFHSATYTLSPRTACVKQFDCNPPITCSGRPKLNSPRNMAVIILRETVSWFPKKRLRASLKLKSWHKAGNSRTNGAAEGCEILILLTSLVDLTAVSKCVLTGCFPVRLPNVLERISEINLANRSN
ncbi:hypothetical protein BaRGS_00035591 [Batillaria attramentaria]|uniref:Secreted protein n=1 Tax=Batillaria attramentaria TaxID=370345 RepID=A0ABD0JE22_9CAEN